MAMSGSAALVVRIQCSRGDQRCSENSSAECFVRYPEGLSFHRYISCCSMASGQILDIIFLTFSKSCAGRSSSLWCCSWRYRSSPLRLLHISCTFPGLFTFGLESWHGPTTTFNSHSTPSCSHQPQSRGRDHSHCRQYEHHGPLPRAPCESRCDHRQLRLRLQTSLRTPLYLRDQWYQASIQTERPRGEEFVSHCARVREGRSRKSAKYFFFNMLPSLLCPALTWKPMLSNLGLTSEGPEAGGVFATLQSKIGTPWPMPMMQSAQMGGWGEPIMDRSIQAYALFEAYVLFEVCPAAFGEQFEPPSGTQAPPPVIYL
ncbi:unnamed protein product [Cercospora beticola]|nr:unnamed protein product [Cercospora beticola]